MPGLCKKFYDLPEGIDPPLEHLYSHVAECKSVNSVVANRGDLIITHALLPHTHSPNHKHYARVITNPHVNLVEPYNLNRPDGDYVSTASHSLAIYTAFTVLTVRHCASR